MQELKLYKARKQFMRKTNADSTLADTIFGYIPQPILDTLSSSKLVAMAEAMLKAYQDGKASAGAEVLNGTETEGAVWVDCLGQAIEWYTDDTGTCCKFED